ncbi:uncharacterized protein LOC143366828 [Andrena cerasifolii]|uniref:uncharacterized protein LOC143366828 n=1 Tax=Andrena cerasifolii TaxID=2819439 RepID=UPI0040382ADA
MRRTLKRHAVPTLFDHHFHCNYTNEALNYGPSTSNFNAMFGEEELPGKSREQCNVTEKKEVGAQTMCGSIAKKDIGVQVTEKCLPPAQTVQELRHKVHVLQMQLLRRDARWNTVIKNLKENGISTQSVEVVLRNRFSGFPLDVLDNDMQNSLFQKIENAIAKK